MIENDVQMPGEQGEHFNCQHDPKWDGNASRSMLCSPAAVAQRPDQLRGATRWYRGHKVTVLGVNDGFASVLFADGSCGTAPCGALQAQPDAPAFRYRVGHHQAQNIYDGDRYIGVMFDPAMAARVVTALNAQERAVRAENWTG